MPEALEERLTSRLRALGEAVDDDIVIPVDLELQVRRLRRRTRSARLWSGAAVAAAVALVATTVVVVRGTKGHDAIRITTSPTTVTPVHDSLQPGTLMLSSRGRWVASLDARGHQNATMVQVGHGEVVYARATDDHHELWYLSLKNGTKACGDVVRADIDGRTSKIVTQAVAFDVSPDGSRLALYGAGDLAHDHCTPVTRSADGRVTVVDLTNATSSTAALGDVAALRWSPDSSRVVVDRCSAFGCGFDRIDVPAAIGAPLVVEPASPSAMQRLPLGSEQRIAFGSDGLYVLTRAVPAGRTGATTSSGWIDRYDAHTLGSPVRVFTGGARWDLAQIVPTAAAVYVIATPVHTTNAGAATGPTGLYRLVDGALVFVRSLVAPGTFTPVTPLATAG